jgi:hypothetical protein
MAEDMLVSALGMLELRKSASMKLSILRNSQSVLIAFSPKRAILMVRS